jgi:hypothetical protein
MLYTLVLICSVNLAPGFCWPDKADMSFQMPQDKAAAHALRPGEDPLRVAISSRRIDLHGRYVVVRNISCSPGAARMSKNGEGILPGDCRDIGSADGQCPSPLFKGACPN